MVSSDEIIESLVASLTANPLERDGYMLRETLRALVRLAQAEKMLAIGEDLHEVGQIAIRSKFSGSLRKQQSQR
jgi:hypothetical protein